MGYSYVPLKLKSEVIRIRTISMITAEILEELRDYVIPDVSTEEISNICLKLIKKKNVDAGLLGYEGFPAPICISVNHVAAHGIPNKYILKNGDIVTLDLTAGLGGWYGDCAITLKVGEITEEKHKLIGAAYKATKAGIKAAVAGCRMGDIGFAINESAENDGFTILKNFIGHGIGNDIHEEPAVLHWGERGSGRPVVPGMVFTIEPIITMGKDDVETLPDGWSMITKDRMPTAQFEHTIAIFSDHTEILTRLK
ncbi:MAG: type I methionyl aminopeptidase [Spirochaetales bacterium]|nr:type I methionyl aminopeptidase [Spirochaetales bacterium]